MYACTRISCGIRVVVLEDETARTRAVEAELVQMGGTHAASIAAVRDEYEERISSMKAQEAIMLHEWKIEYARVCDLLQSDGLKFEESLDQVEVEGEIELNRKSTEFESRIADERNRSDHLEKAVFTLRRNEEKDAVSLRDMRLESRGLNELVGKLQAELASEKGECVALRNRVQEEHRRVDTRDSEIQQLQKELQRFHQSHYLVDQNRLGLQARTTEMQDTIAEQNAVIEQLETDLSTERTANGRSQVEIAERRLQVGSLKHQIKRLVEVNLDLRNRIVRMGGDPAPAEEATEIHFSPIVSPRAERRVTSVEATDRLLHKKCNAEKKRLLSENERLLALLQESDRVQEDDAAHHISTSGHAFLTPYMKRLAMNEAKGTTGLCESDDATAKIKRVPERPTLVKHALPPDAGSPSRDEVYTGGFIPPTNLFPAYPPSPSLTLK